MRLIDADELLEDPYFQDTSIPKRFIFIEAVKQVQPIDPVKHGRWIKPVPGDGEPYCSVCKCYQPWVWGDGYQQYAFCPYCGAKMDAEN